MLGPVHAADHGGIVHDADLDGLEDVVGTGEALEPDDAVELDAAAFAQLVEGLEDEVARVGLLEGIVGGGGVLGHAGDAAYAKGDAEEGEDGLAEVCEGLCGVGGVVVEHGDEDVGGAEAFCELDDDGELVDEEVVGGVDDHADVVEVVLACEVFVRVLVLVLAKGAGERRTEGGDPAVEGEELLDGRENRLLVYVGGVVAEDAGRGERGKGGEDVGTHYGFWKRSQ